MSPRPKMLMGSLRRHRKAPYIRAVIQRVRSVLELTISLVFLGSKDYPYKGVLDHLANRAGSNGTNAWTANDRELRD